MASLRTDFLSADFTGDNAKPDVPTRENAKPADFAGPGAEPDHAVSAAALPRSIHLVPFDIIEGYEVRPGFYDIDGATAIPGGVNFTIYSHYATRCELLLYHPGEDRPYAVLPFPEHYKIGNVYSMIVFKLAIAEFEYAYRMDGPYDPRKGLIFDKTKVLLDPYAKAVSGISEWGNHSKKYPDYHARVVRDDFEWGNQALPLIPMHDLVIYELHVRGFTKHGSSGVRHPGTFDGLREKIPYMKELGINAVELMPIFEFDEMLDYREMEDGRKLYNYWGYNTLCFFSSDTNYSSKREHNRQGNELKCLIKEFHKAGIEVFLDVVFNHTAEGDEQGHFISFKGVDNNIYYMLAPEGRYYNFSGCGNTMNCNHPIVQHMIRQCLRYWVTAYRVDGFRFDLASILGRNEDGSPMKEPPLLQSLAFDPILGDVKLIAEAWDAGGLYQVGNFPSWNRWAEWNGQYRDDLRQFLKGDEGVADRAVRRISGSPDLYPPELRPNASVNFLTCHDGFTLNDLYSYNHKHNMANGWDNTDGSNCNYSWNCGLEGDTEDPKVLTLRRRMARNACAVLMASRGTPMFLAGDEFLNTQFGNNNPYCQDNEISWLDWGLLEVNQDIFQFFKRMIQFRKEHLVVRKPMRWSSLGFSDISWHNVRPFCNHFSYVDHYVGVMFAGEDKQGQQDVVYVAVNSYWEGLEVFLPGLPKHMCWKAVVDTWAEDGLPEREMVTEGHFFIRPRTVVVLTVCEAEPT